MSKASVNKPPEFYACLYVKEFPAQAMLRLRPGLRDQPCAILEGEPPLEAVASLNHKARLLGITPGMTRVEADTFSAATLLNRSAAEELSAQASLLECAGIFTPRVESHTWENSWYCVLDITGTEKLHGAPASLGKILLQRVKALGFQVSVAISRSFHAAICLARSISAGYKVAMILPGEEAATLASLPVHVLDLSLDHASTLSMWGIHTLGMLAALPEKSLIARMGQEGKTLRQLALGELPHLFQPVEPVFTLEERMELETPVELLDSLLFVIGVLLEQLILRANARILALASVTITLTLEGDASCTPEPHTRTVRPALPSNDRPVWIKLLHLDLEAHPPPAAIVALQLTAEPGKTSKVQMGLFSPQLPESSRLDVTLVRIRSIVGEDCAGSPTLQDTHRPDAFRMDDFRVTQEVRPGKKKAALSESPKFLRTHTAVRQLRPAETISLTISSNKPAFFYFREKRYEVERAYGPWLASGDWWNPTLWTLEQWDIVARAAGNSDGTLLCCCLVRDPAQNTWQMVALYD